MALLAVLAVGGSAVGVMIFQIMQGKEKPPSDAGGFDIASTVNAPKTDAAGEEPIGAESPSSLGMVQGGMPGIKFGEGGGEKQDVAQKVAASFTEAVRASEAKVRAIAMRYTKKYPVVAQFGKEWMSHPDLKKLNDNYMVDHDPVRFLKGLSQSRNFGPLARKYAMNPIIQSAVKECSKEVPSGVMSAAMDLMKQDKVIKDLISNTAASLGLPAGLFSAAEGGKVDQNQIMGQIMQGNPQLQKSMQDPAIQKTLKNDPNLQRKLQEQQQNK